MDKPLSHSLTIPQANPTPKIPSKKFPKHKPLTTNQLTNDPTQKSNLARPMPNTHPSTPKT
jgi:hypothetical protein